MILLTPPSVSARIVMPATDKANHIKTRHCENAGRSKMSTPHQAAHRDCAPCLLAALPSTFFWDTITSAIESSSGGFEHSPGSLDGFFSLSSIPTLGKWLY